MSRKLEGEREYHGFSHSPEWRIWRSMQSRCSNPNQDSFKYYGARGIRVCPRWRRSFAAFLEDMGPRPAGAQIDRIDNGQDYQPDNCRWVTAKQNARNRRSNINLTIRNTTKTLTEWCEVFGVDFGAARHRVHTGWPADKIFAVPFGAGFCPECRERFEGCGKHYRHKHLNNHSKAA